MSQKAKYIAFGFVAFLLIGVFVLAKFTRALDKFIPGLIVGTRTVTADELNNIVAFAQKIQPSADREQVIEQIIRQQKIKILLHKNNNDVSAQEVADEFKYETAGKQLPWDEKIFKFYISLPQAEEAALRIDYNHDLIKNKNEFAKVLEILSEVLNNNDFDELAKSQSDDKFTGQFGGDLGFFEEGQVIPELSRVILVAPPNKAYDHIVVSRFGYHILYPLLSGTKDGKKVWHAKHILIKTSGFEDWFNQQVAGIRVFKIKG